jgi:hypothetical protein
VIAHDLFVQAEPDLADWLQGWGTVAGAAFSALAFLATLGLLMHEIRVRRRDEQDRMASQARLVTTTTHAVGDIDGQPMVFAEVTNHSAAPVFDIVVAPQQKAFRTMVGDGQYMTDLSIRDLHYLTSDVYLLDQLNPGQVHNFPSWEGHYGTSAVGAGVRLPVTTEFTDAAGLRWRRHNRGRPKRI